MTPDPKRGQEPDQPLSPELERHLPDPAVKTEEVSGEQDRARRHDDLPTEPGASTEQQPT